MASETTTSSQLQLRFKRSDITSVGTTHRRCLRVLPGSKAKSRQKVVVGDVTGVARCFGVGKHHELKMEFDTPKPATPAEVTNVALFRDQIFLALGNRICAYTKKGKAFYINETSLSEPMLHLEVNTPFQHTAGDFVLTHFRETTEAGFFMSPDKINDLVSVPRDAEGNIDVYIAGQDRTVRCVRGREMRQQMGCEAPVTAIAWNVKGDVKQLENPMAALDLVYGTLSGSIGGLRAAVDGFTRRFSAVPPNRLATITGLRAADLTSDGVNDVIVARDDGSVELHSFEMNPDGTPVSSWAGGVNEYVSSLDVGTVTHSDRPDLVISTFSGKVVCFTATEEDVTAKSVVPSQLQGAQPQLMTAEGSAAAAREIKQRGGSGGEDAPDREVLKVKIQATMDEIASIRHELSKKKAELAGAPADAGKKAQQAAIEKIRAVAPTFTMREKMVLDDSGTIVLSVELDTVLDSVSLTSHVAFEVVQDAASNDEARISTTDPSVCPGSKAKLLAVFRTPPESQQKSLQMRLRPTEGFSGQIQVYVTPRTNPKSILKRTFEIPALSLHQRVAEDTVDGAADPAASPNISTVTLTGNFTIKDAHAWMYRSFFDVPQNVTGEEGRLTFRNTYSGAKLYVRYRRGELFVAGHNLSALAMVRDYVAREAALRKVQLQMDVRPSQESLFQMLELLHPMVEREAKLARAVKIIDALKEVESQEQDVNFLSEEYRDMLRDADDIAKAHSSQPQRLQYVLGILERLLNDRATFRDGTPATPAKLQELHQLVGGGAYSLEGLRQFFSS